ncbi:TVP38/TMEM64 family protein [Psychroflexus sp. CAK1W]|uniref:TVP38/TMEM64 family protein n=1 Tax=Psychroflexus curvus TaxID=2873595 RepID=UPI001CCC1CB4|nr:TVP38/TMEM64 family protein [Psychroflexus curvus]MBZ9628834.1 TVP38/TMEM64 family protein [Psychroflexus curvus]
MNNSAQNKNNKSHLPLVFTLTLLGGMVAGYFFVPSLQQFLDEAWRVLSSNDEQRIKNWVDDFGWYGPLVLILAMVVQMFLIVIPSLALMVVSILAYGAVWGSIISLVAIFAASSVGYFVGRYLGQTIIMKLLGEKTETKIKLFLNNYGFWAVIITRLNPFLSNDAISFVGGMLKMGYWRFIGATLFGILPLTVFIAVLGENLERLKWGALIFLLGFVYYVWWDNKPQKHEE